MFRGPGHPLRDEIASAFRRVTSAVPTIDDYQQFPADHVLWSTSSVSQCADNAAAEEPFGVFKGERANRRRYTTIAESRQDVFDFIERFCNPRVRRGIQANDNASPLTQPAAEQGRTLARSDTKKARHWRAFDQGVVLSPGTGKQSDQMSSG